MKYQWMKWILGTFLAVGLITPAMAAEKVTVFAAASLTNALNDIAVEYKKEKGIDIVASYASSSVLARQIVQGAPADLFISADQQWMDYVVDKKSIDVKTRHTLLGNDLVVIANNRDKTTNIEVNKTTQWHKLLDGGRLAVGDPDHVPAGLYAKEALISLGAWTQIENRLARANNVRSAMALVERGEAPLGIVYGSDAIASKKVKVVGIFPQNSHKPVEYPMAVVEGHQSVAVQNFYNYLKMPKAKTIFTQYGFTPVK